MVLNVDQGKCFNQLDLFYMLGNILLCLPNDTLHAPLRSAPRSMLLIITRTPKTPIIVDCE